MLSRGAKLKLGLTYWASAVTLFGVVSWSTLTVVGMKQDLGRAEKDRAALAQQVKNMGGTPVAGPRGNAGVPGRNGRTGDTGATGPRGTDGVNGAPGSSGSNGAKGSDGKAGRDGVAGAAGRDGVDGRDGAQGPKGDPGDQGPVGPVGPAGPQCPEGYAPDQTWFGAQQVSICTKSQTLGG